MAGYSLIYEPKGRAREYAALACNIYRGCGHGCIYCYGPSATRRTRDDFAQPQTRGDNFVNRLALEAARKPGHGERVLLCFTCDPYQQLDQQTELTRLVIKVLHAGGYSVEVLTKGGSRALRDLDLFGEGDAFASTLTWLDDTRSLEWEPGAALPSDRIAAIKAFHDAGVETWVSLEPVLWPSVALEIIRQTHQFVDLFKVGKLNYVEKLPAHLRDQVENVNWRAFGMDAVNLLRALGKSYYIKCDLAAYLPPEYQALCGEMPEPARREPVGQLSLF